MVPRRYGRREHGPRRRRPHRPRQRRLRLLPVGDPPAPAVPTLRARRAGEGRVRGGERAAAGGAASAAGRRRAPVSHRGARVHRAEGALDPCQRAAARKQRAEERGRRRGRVPRAAVFAVGGRQRAEQVLLHDQALRGTRPGSGQALLLRTHVRPLRAAGGYAGVLDAAGEADVAVVMMGCELGGVVALGLVGVVVLRLASLSFLGHWLLGRAQFVFALLGLHVLIHS